MYPSWDPIIVHRIRTVINQATRTGRVVHLGLHGYIARIQPNDDPWKVYFIFNVVDSGKIQKWWRRRTPEQLATAMIKPSDTFTFSPEGKEVWERTIAEYSTNPAVVFDENRQDPAFMTALRFAARWAHLMEVAMASGSNLEDVAMDTSLEAALEGTWYGLFWWSIGILTDAWVHGEELKAWSENHVGIKVEANNQPDEEIAR